MIIVRAPMRMSFGGGGTDLATYYTRFGGYVVSAAISRYCYVMLNERTDRTIRISSADYHTWESIPHYKDLMTKSSLALPRAVLHWFFEHQGLSSGVDLFLASEVAPGTGLGSSSAMTVALIKALSTFCRYSLSPREIAELACYIEIELLQSPIGKQDQYASALGGLNAIEFTARGVHITPLHLPADVISSLNKRLLLFMTGKTRNSADILKKQQKDTQEQARTVETLHRMKALAFEMREVLEAGDLDRFGSLLDCAWREKRSLSANISSLEIDRYYEAAREAGALGGKITGAGGGGFLLLYCPLLYQRAVREAMAQCGLCEMSFDFDFVGSGHDHLITRRGADYV